MTTEIESECAECGYPFIYANSQDPCPRCGSTKKHSKVNIQNRIGVSTSIELESKKEYTQLNKKIHVFLIIILIIGAILSLLFNQIIFIIVGIILDVIGFLLSPYASKKIIERDHYH